MTHRKRILISTAVLAVLLGILSAGTLDYKISVAMVDKSSAFGKIFRDIGELPAVFGMFLGVVILYGARRREVMWKNVLSSVVALPFMLLFSYSVFFMPARYIYEHTEGGIPTTVKYIIYTLALVLFIAAVIIINRQKPEKVREYRKAGLVLLILVFTEVFLVNILKILWARPRMRSIQSIEQFKYWYQINGPSTNEELKSFPSGHVANAFTILAYSLFIPKNKPTVKKWFIAFALLWGTLVAVSRIVIGAHFFSDVVAAGYITTLLFYLIRKKFAD